MTFQESEIKPLSQQELFLEITAEIDFYQQQIAILQQQLAVVKGGSPNA
jgi:prefoldin subunit 5